MLPGRARASPVDGRGAWIYDSTSRGSHSSPAGRARRARLASAFSPRCLSFSSPAYQPPSDDVAIGDIITAVHGRCVNGMSTHVRRPPSARAQSWVEVSATLTPLPLPVDHRMSRPSFGPALLKRVSPSLCSVTCGQACRLHRPVARAQSATPTRHRQRCPRHGTWLTPVAVQPAATFLCCAPG